MNSCPGSTTGCERMSPDRTSTNTSRTSLGGWLGAGDDDAPGDDDAAPLAAGAADSGGAGNGLALALVGALAAGRGDALPPAIGWTRRAAMVRPSGDHQKLTTLPSRSVRILPVSASIR